MERVGECNLCGSRTAFPYVSGRDRLHGLEGSFQFVRCSSCGLIYLDPRPAAGEMAHYYPEDYEPYSQSPRQEKSWLNRLDRERGIASLCGPVIRAAGARAGRVLDIGCATGNFLDGMRARGWETYGVEPSLHAAHYARERLGLDVREGTIEHVVFEPDFFDVVTLWHVLEHVFDPAATLREAARILKPGGWIILTVPHLESWEAAWFGRYWLGLDMPRHLFLFTRPVLRRYLENSGFCYVRDACITGKHTGVITSLRFWSTDWHVSENVRQRALALVQSKFTRLLTFPYYKLAGLLKQGSFITVFARKNRPGPG
jgi:SAM-dependent methyltransferase